MYYGRFWRKKADISDISTITWLTFMWTEDKFRSYTFLLGILTDYKTCNQTQEWSASVLMVYKLLESPTSVLYMIYRFIGATPMQRNKHTHTVDY